MEAFVGGPFHLAVCLGEDFYEVEESVGLDGVYGFFEFELEFLWDAVVVCGGVYFGDEECAEASDEVF